MKKNEKGNLQERMSSPLPRVFLNSEFLFFRTVTIGIRILESVGLRGMLCRLGDINKMRAATHSSHDLRATIAKAPSGLSSFH